MVPNISLRECAYQCTTSPLSLLEEVFRKFCARACRIFSKSLTFVYSAGINYQWDCIHDFVHQTLGYLKRHMGNNITRVQMKWVKEVRREMKAGELRRNICRQLRVEPVEQSSEYSLIPTLIQQSTKTLLPTLLEEQVLELQVVDGRSSLTD